MTKDIVVVGVIVAVLLWLARRADVQAKFIIRDLEADDLDRLRRMQTERRQAPTDLVELERLWEMSHDGPNGDIGYERGGS